MAGEGAVAVRVDGVTVVAPVGVSRTLSVRTVARFLGVRRSKVHGYLRAGTWPGSVRQSTRRWSIRTRAFVGWYAQAYGIPEREAWADLAAFLPAARRN